MATRKKSPMTSFEKLSPNRNKPRTGPIRRLTPHHAGGNCTAEIILGLPSFQTYNTTSGTSANYATGSDGRIGLGVEETNRAWTSSSYINDHEAITFELSNDGGAPDWHMSSKTINSFLDQAVETAKFYGFKKINYVEKPANITPAKVEAWIKTWAKDDEMIITLHNWFKATVCPGPYFMRQLPWLVKEMNKRLSNSKYKPEAFVGEGGTATGQPIPLVEEEKPVPPTTKPIDVIPDEILPPKKPVFNPYEIVITVSALNIRAGAGVGYGIVKTLSMNDKNVYTIVEEADGPSDLSDKSKIAKWGKLKSGIGWILLSYTKRK